MDKKTIIGLGLIGVILAVFTFFNQPSEQELKAAMAKKEQQLAKKNKAENTTDSKTSPAVHQQENMENDSIESPVQSSEKAQLAKHVEEQTFVLENDKIKVIFSNYGGGVKSVFLKEYQTYANFKKNEGTDKITPLHLLDENQASNGLVFEMDGKEVNTKELAFQVEKSNDKSISFVATLGGDKSIHQSYKLTEGSYHLNYNIEVEGLGEDVDANQIYLDWNAELLKTERLLSEQRRVSTVFYKENNDTYDYLSEMSDDEMSADKDLDWVAFKQSYFSSILIPKVPFQKSGSYLKIDEFGEGSPKDSTRIKKYAAMLNIGLDNPDNGSASFQWYFGPNDYDILNAYNAELEDIINYGWGIFRWLNIFIIQPVFGWLADFGMNLGIAILLLTVIIKLVLTPIQWKMFASSAKMRILKPEMDEINKKYPNKEDAMKKQMEVMTLYKESGASPLSGCVPMLIQMPILFAVFRFFPAAFDLRQEGFLWADDLSSYDSIWDFGFNIPLYGDHVSLFTLLMAITTLFYTILNSSNMQQPSQPGMPNMKIIMYIFPFMMIFFFNNYASGLSLYYFISTLMSILTMIMIKNFFVDEEKLKAKMALKKEEAKKSGKKAGKSKFQERLEQMQKAQQEQMKNRKR